MFKNIKAVLLIHPLFEVNLRIFFLGIHTRQHQNIEFLTATGSVGRAFLSSEVAHNHYLNVYSIPSKCVDKT